MAHFYPLLVTDIKQDTRDAVIVTLEPPEEAREKFDFIQGQYLTFRRMFDGDEKRRSYSICSGIEDGILRVGVKKVEDGWFSSWINDELEIGDTIDAMTPMGKFFTPIDPLSARHYIGFAGGSGITPMISLIKSMLNAEPHSRFSLVYANRSSSAIMFREELEDIKNMNMGRLSITHILETQADVDLFSGRLDREKCDQLLSSWIDVDDVDLAFICGPQPMMLGVAAALKARGMGKDAIKFELFSSPHTGRAKKPIERSVDAATATCMATIIRDGTASQVKIQRGEKTVLEAALDANIDAPYSCTAGVCSTCVARLVDGEVEMDANYSLEDYEVKRGFILTCQSHPVTDKIVVDYDQQ